MADEPGAETPEPEPRRGYRDSLDPAAHLGGQAIRVFRFLSIVVAVILAIAACAFAVCALG